METRVKQVINAAPGYVVHFVRMSDHERISLPVVLWAVLEYRDPGEWGHDVEPMVFGFEHESLLQPASNAAQSWGLDLVGIEYAPSHKCTGWIEGNYTSMNTEERAAYYERLTQEFEPVDDSAAEDF